MIDAAVSGSASEDEMALATPFVKCLVRLIRAQEPYTLWEGKSDAMLLADFIVTRQERRGIPEMAYPDPNALWKLDLFYSAVGLAIAERFHSVTPPIVGARPSRPLGAGFSVPGVGSFFPEVHRFGFETFRQLAEAGTKLVDDATADIQAPDVAMA
ncbi:conserved hypothetical protein [Mesorhizobium plurifarium]|uniref:DUF269 domain-containing protein n=1 Tax=Mesorhizobium plurifarium TaxID=69974 RepID=A0A0K2VTG3_MESPL|nr:conserved hypothetical protein [Mesorhizobium plurifarium]